MQQIGDRAGEASTWHQLATIDFEEGKYGEAREKFSKSLEIKQQIGNRAGEAATFYQLGWLAKMEGRPEKGIPMLALCYLIDREIGHGDTESDFKTLRRGPPNSDTTRHNSTKSSKRPGHPTRKIGAGP